jgi:hypothetical protein
MVAATHDEAIPFADARWLYSLLPAEQKRFALYDSGHSLPAAYVDTVVDWFRTWL